MKNVFIAICFLISNLAYAETFHTDSANKVTHRNCELNVAKSGNPVIDSYLRSAPLTKVLSEKGFLPRELTSYNDLIEGELVLRVSNLNCNNIAAKFTVFKKCSAVISVSKVLSSSYRNRYKVLWQKSSNAVSGSVSNYGFTRGSLSQLMEELILDALFDKDGFFRNRSSLHCSVD